MKHNLKKWNVLLIGLGQIGMGYDLSSENLNQILTHAKAFFSHESFNIIAGVDKDNEKCRKFMNAFPYPAYNSLDDAVIRCKPDIVVISTPTKEHIKTIYEIFNVCVPRLILCEKPLAYNSYDAEEIIRLCGHYKTDIFVNYMRRVDPGVIEVKSRIISRAILPPIKAVVWYTKGLLNNGSHFFDLMKYWLGNVRRTEVLKRSIRDSIDPEPDFFAEYNFGEAYFIAADEHNFSHYTIEMVAANGRLRYEQGGRYISWQNFELSRSFPGYKYLSDKNDIINSDIDRIQWLVAENIAKELSGEITGLCRGEDALETFAELNHVITRGSA